MPKNKDYMCTIWKSYRHFWSMACGEMKGRPYREICRAVKVSPVDLDECLAEELGMNGEELTEILRTLSVEEVRKPDEVFHPKPFGPQVEHGVRKDAGRSGSGSGSE